MKNTVPLPTFREVIGGNLTMSSDFLGSCEVLVDRFTYSLYYQRSTDADGTLFSKSVQV